MKNMRISENFKHLSWFILTYLDLSDSYLWLLLIFSAFKYIVSYVCHWFPLFRWGNANLPESMRALLEGDCHMTCRTKIGGTTSQPPSKSEDPLSGPFFFCCWWSCLFFLAKKWDLFLESQRFCQQYACLHSWPSFLVTAQEVYTTVLLWDSYHCPKSSASQAGPAVFFFDGSFVEKATPWRINWFLSADDLFFLRFFMV